MGKNPSSPGELLQGTLDLLILHTLEHRTLHGYGVMDAIWSTSGEIVRVDEGALYPGLHRLELKGWLKSKWGVSENNRRAKYYTLTAAGRRQLEAEREQWSRLSMGIGRVLGHA